MANVAVVGCGRTGSAVARAFAQSGHSVTVWNRTAAHARALTGPGIVAVDSVDDAVRSAPLVVTCTLNYETTSSALALVADLAGVALVNLSVGAPAQATSMGVWAAKRGADYLDGMPACFPREIGSAAAMVLYSGSLSAWRAHEKTLSCLGAASLYLSDDVTLTNVLETGLGSFFFTAQRAYLEVMNYLEDAGAPTKVVRTLTNQVIDVLRTTTAQTIDAAESDERETAGADQATIAMFADAVQVNLQELRDAGHPAPLLAAAARDLEEIAGAGLGHLGVHARSPINREM